MKDPYEKASLPQGLDDTDERPIVMDSNEAFCQINIHKLSITNPRHMESLNVTTTMKNQAQVDELFRMINNYKSLFENSEIEKEEWKQKDIKFEGGK